ncbi:calcium-binding protein [Pseudomonas fluorescens]|uniref:Calcium-binding protein n=1 Tax=Pseudomonas fluorescens TaxID=294 RepID=A0A5E7VU09_PSEFL|nr:calcium-binding protein [Pseudomonas fluorescens]VVQ26331.1 hypothetical protein PS928_06497 [Pseudomonas fluorescens]
MAQLIEPAVENSTRRTIQVTAISASANNHAPASGRIDTSPSAPPLTPVSPPARATSQIDTSPSAPPLTPVEQPAPDTAVPGQLSRRSLKILDEHFGALRFGNSTVTRAELKAMGARVHGQAISSANANMPAPDQDFLDGLSFDSAKVEARVRSAKTPDSSTVATLFYEITLSRSVDAPPLFIAADPLTPASSMDRLNKLGNAAQKMDIHHLDTNENHPRWVNRGKSLASVTGVGLQAYGIYSGFIGTLDALKAGDLGEAAFNSGSIASEVGSLIIERGLAKGGVTMIESGSVVFSRFSATSAGAVFSRGAGLFASLITLPFDIASAVKSFNAAAAAHGKEAQDHYVSGGLSVAGAGVSLVLGAVALAGFGTLAGGLGLAAAAVLILGSEIYRAVRVVDDIDDYIELTAHERLRSGWFAFTRQELDQDVMDRFKIAKAYSDHTKELEVSAKDLLEGAYKHYVEYVINGSFNIELKPVQIWRYQWNEDAGERPFELDKVPVIVGGDDIIDARDGIAPNLKGSVKGSPGEDKGVLWRLGDGNDQVFGVTDQPNLFSYREGAKALTGGDKDDGFYFETTEEQLNRPLKPARTSTLEGGEGSDTLAFEGTLPAKDTRHVGYDINLQTGKVALRNHDPATDDILIAQVKSIENISTLRRGSNRVTGSDMADRISANGNDHINAGPGDDSIAIRGADCRVDGGPGTDRYYIAETSAQATIIEDGEQPSLIAFGWPMERIQRWRIVDSSLVVSSLRGKDGELPEHVLTIENVYKPVDGQRQVNNSQLQFRTRDGYGLVPQLPAHLTDALPHDIECTVTVIGDRAPAPQIVNSGAVVIAEQESRHHFVSRDGRRVDFFAKANTPETSRTLHLDYKYEEILDIKYNYEVEALEGVTGDTFLSYSNFRIWFYLPSKIIVFVDFISENQQKKTSANGFPNIKTADIQGVHDIVLVMQDGESYRLPHPYIPFQEDAAAPGYKIRSGAACLRRRHGNYRFIRPQRIKPFLLAATPQKINFPSASLAGIHALHGQASSYDVYPASNTTFSLSTPGAVTQTSNASTWTIYSSELTETVTRNEIQLTSENLQVGSAVIELPSLDHPGPVESISVATSSGNIYSVELLFEVLQLYLINAQGYTSVDALLADIRAHQERNELAVKVSVNNIGVTSRIGARVYYNSTNDYWGIDTDLTLRIKPEDLIIDPAQNT